MRFVFTTDISLLLNSWRLFHANTIMLTILENKGNVRPEAHMFTVCLSTQIFPQLQTQ